MAFISKSKIDLVDLVSVLIKNEDDTCYLLLQNAENQYNLPWDRVYDGNWKEAAIRILSLMDLEIPLAAIKLYKFWVPYNPNSSIFHSIFKVVLPNCAKRRIRLNALQDDHTLKWILKKDLHKLRIKNKELLHALDIFPNLASVVGSPCDIPLFEKIINRTDFLIEIQEKDIILEPNSSDDFYSNLIDCSNYTKDDQHRLYKEFLSNCFPNFYMNLANFRKFLEKFTINNMDAVSLFRAADVYKRGELSFRDFLYIIIACDSTTQHSGSIAEIRSSYIFRYYAKQNINFLQPNEFGCILAAIHDAKNVKYDELSIAKETELVAISIGVMPGKPFDLVHFLVGVGELKIRGTSILLRFKPSIRNSIKIIDGHANNTKCAIANFRKTASLPESYEIETNAVILKKNIPKYNIIDLGDKDHWMSGVALTAIRNLTMRNLSFRNPSIKSLSISDNKNEYVSRESKDSLSIDSLCKEVLSHLKYFADFIPATATIGGKDSFSWATTNLFEFGVQLLNVCEALKSIVGMEPRLLALKEPVYIFGDLHGNFQELKRFEKSLFHYGLELCPATSLFLGDYVDRGTMSVEVIAYLFASKKQNNENLYLLRGNHEMRDIQKKFTFYNECIQKFGDSLGEEIWNKVNEVFDTLPLAATINKTIFCCHGGIPPPWLCSRASDINNIPVYMPSPLEQSQLAWNLLWNDPIPVADANPQIKYELMKKNGFAENRKRGTGNFFSEIAVLNFLKTNNYSYVIRAHEFQPAGIYFQFGGKLITVFSTSNYCGLQNDAACVFVNKRKIHVLNFEN